MEGTKDVDLLTLRMFLDDLPKSPCDEKMLDEFCSICRKVNSDVYFECQKLRRRLGLVVEGESSGKPRDIADIIKKVDEKLGRISDEKDADDIKFEVMKKDADIIIDPFAGETGGDEFPMIEIIKPSFKEPGDEPPVSLDIEIRKPKAVMFEKVDGEPDADGPGGEEEVVEGEAVFELADIPEGKPASASKEKKHAGVTVEAVGEEGEAGEIEIEDAVAVREDEVVEKEDGGRPGTDASGEDGSGGDRSGDDGSDDEPLEVQPLEVEPMPFDDDDDGGGSGDDDGGDAEELGDDAVLEEDWGDEDSDEIEVVAAILEEDISLSPGAVSLADEIKTPPKKKKKAVKKKAAAKTPVSSKGGPSKKTKSTLKAKKASKDIGTAVLPGDDGGTPVEAVVPIGEPAAGGPKPKKAKKKAKKTRKEPDEVVESVEVWEIGSDEVEENDDDWASQADPAPSLAGRSKTKTKKKKAIKRKKKK